MPLIEATHEGFVAQSYVMVLRDGLVPSAGVILTGVYRDLLSRDVDGAWRIARRVATLDPAPEHRGEQPYDVLVVARDLIAREHEGVLAEAQAIHTAGEGLSG